MPNFAEELAPRSFETQPRVDPTKGAKEVRDMPDYGGGSIEGDTDDPGPDHVKRLREIFKTMLILSYEPAARAQSEAAALGLTMDIELSTENTYVYFDHQSDFPLIVHRGSMTASDWLLEDALILTGLVALTSSPRNAVGAEITRLVEEKYGQPADAFGHSLGGRVAEVSGASGYVFTYNKAAGLGDIAAPTRPRQTDYRNKKDIVSLLSETQTHPLPIKYVGEDESLFNSHGLGILPETVERRE
ncbi:hypothetical protein T492DRAFT_841890 [Pavlovales sp. CCMP2436]|nr:hypothetical protein T492DRAFT_841890 [Pavlovales sp. CCMP2436]